MHGAGVRYRGSPFMRALSGTRKGLRVRLRDEDSLLGAVRLTLDEQTVDQTFQVDRFLRYAMQKEGGIPYGERHYVRVVLAGIPMSGVYEHVLHVDPRYLERAFGDDRSSGSLYKLDAHYEVDDRGERRDPRFLSWAFTENEELLRFIFKKRSHEELDDFSDLISLLRVMSVRETPAEEFDETIGDTIDVDSWVKLIAIYRVFEDWDAIGGWTCLLYTSPSPRDPE